MSIMSEIVAQRRARIEREGAALGVTLPEERRRPVVPFGRDPFVICEIKRRSPSRGVLAEGLDATAQAALYAGRGARTLSVLTEEDHFGGSLADLVAVKERFPDLCVLRKDFLLTVDDVETSFRAGADAVLLIAGILDRADLERMYARASELGLAALVEVHTAEEVEKIAPIAPEITGINARDLKTFNVDLALPLMLRGRIDWNTRLVFESGIHSREQAAFAAASGFAGILVGEAVVKRPELVEELVSGLADASGNAPTDGGSRRGDERDGKGATSRGHAVSGPGRRDFWARLFASQAERNRPLVKICGLTNREDALLADSLGADLLGFIFAPSKRRVDPAVVAAIGPTRAAKVAVVVMKGDEEALDPELTRLLEQGLIDAVQFHGDEPPEACYRLAFPYYKALQLESAADCARIARYRCPRVLLDAHVPGLRGGTGVRLEGSLIEEARKSGPLWLAGGIGPGNVFDIVERFRPELVDASSALEATPGRKDPERLATFFAEVERVSGAETVSDTMAHDEHRVRSK